MSPTIAKNYPCDDIPTAAGSEISLFSAEPGFLFTCFRYYRR